MLRSLSAQDVLSIWETGLHQHCVDRALTILHVALPELASDMLLSLSVGQRDTHLLTIREATFGSQLTCFAECPACQEQLEFTFDIADIYVAPLIEVGNQEQQMVIDGYELRFRLPDSRDLAMIAHCRDIAIARNLLIQRCILHAAQNGEGVMATTLPETVITRVAEQIEQRDPQAEVQLSLCCPACDQRWFALFDIASFFWTEICALAKHLLREVHTLARAYGWHEADILSMSTARRQFYLEMVI